MRILVVIHAIMYVSIWKQRETTNSENLLKLSYMDGKISYIKVVYTCLYIWVSLK